METFLGVEAGTIPLSCAKALFSGLSVEQFGGCWDHQSCLPCVLQLLMLEVSQCSCLNDCKGGFQHAKTVGHVPQLLLPPNLKLCVWQCLACFALITQTSTAG